MTVRFKRRASHDLRAAREWYEARVRGLGKRFILEFDEVIADVQAAPLSYQVVEGDVRRALLLHFPFSIYYLPEGSSITVLAVLHFRQHPAAWKVAP